MSSVGCWIVAIDKKLKSDTRPIYVIGNSSGIPNALTATFFNNRDQGNVENCTAIIAKIIKKLHLYLYLNT